VSGQYLQPLVPHEDQGSKWGRNTLVIEDLEIIMDEPPIATVLVGEKASRTFLQWKHPWLSGDSLAKDWYYVEELPWLGQLGQKKGKQHRIAIVNIYQTNQRDALVTDGAGKLCQSTMLAQNFDQQDTCDQPDSRTCSIALANALEQKAHRRDAIVWWWGITKGHTETNVHAWNAQKDSSQDRWSN